jgi:hypothetical protein
VLEVFNRTSLLAFGGVLALMLLIGARLRASWVAPLLVLTALASPLLYYSASTFGESLATFLILLATVACLLRAPPLAIAAAVLAAGTTKETIWPFLAILGGVALWATPIARAALARRHWVGLGVGVFAAIVTHAAFDYWRWGTLTNKNYTRDFFTVPDYVLSAKIALSMWGAPNAAIPLWWPLAAALLLAALMIAFSGLRGAARDRRGWLPAATAVFLALVQTGLLSRWFAPFGWNAWGPRLALPLLPALVLLVVVCHADQLQRGVAAVAATRLRLAAAAALVLALVVPQVAILHQDEALAKLFNPNPACAPGLNPVGDSGPYYHCLFYRSWHMHLTLLDSLPGATRTASASVLLIVVLAACAGLVLAVARGVRSEAPASSSAAAG